jgi:hypothetical protein
MKKMEIRQTKMSGRVRRPNCGRSAHSSERLGDLLVRRRTGMRLITPYDLPLNNCLICFKPLDPVKPYQAIWILMRGPNQICAGAFFFTSSMLASSPATSPGKSSSSLARAKEMDLPGVFKTSATCAKKWRNGRFVRRYFEEKMLKFTDSRTTSVRREREAVVSGISGVN